MKKLIYYSTFLLAATLAGCSNELAEPVMNPDHIESGAAAMQVTISFPQPKSYANEEENAGIPEEKEIQSLAFFVKTPHAFGKFYSDDQPLSPNGFTEPLTKKGDQYTASFKMRSTKFGISEVIAVANYKENGLDFSKVTTIKQLKEVVAAMPVDKENGNAPLNLKTPLLMYASNNVELIEEQAASLTLNMERLVARLDVVNAANAPGDDQFVLQSVRLLNAPAKSALLSEQGLTFGKGVDLPERTLAIAGDAFVKCTYLYETPNNAANLQPRIEVKGTYRGAQVLQEIPFNIAEQPGAPSTPAEFFPILRNHRYTLTILPSDKTEELEFTITVKEWNGGETITVKPVVEAPLLENFNLAGIGGIAPADKGVSWDPTTTTLTIRQTLALTGQEAITLTFDASAYQTPVCTMALTEAFEGADVGNTPFLAIANVKMGDVVGYAQEESKLKRSITLTLPQALTVVADAVNTNYLRVQANNKTFTPVTVVLDGRPVTP